MDIVLICVAIGLLGVAIGSGVVSYWQVMRRKAVVDADKSRKADIRDLVNQVEDLATALKKIKQQYELDFAELNEFVTRNINKHIARSRVADKKLQEQEMKENVFEALQSEAAETMPIAATNGTHSRKPGKGRLKRRK